VCVYATEADLITCSEAQISDSDCIWTNSRQFQADWDPEALYFDPSSNRHYGIIINDHWKLDENCCNICWNEETKRVEVWSLVPIPLYKELETNYNDPYWYRPHNGLTTLIQATQVRDYYGRKDLPWYAEMEDVATTTGVSAIATIFSEPMEGKTNEQAEVQERNKRDRECKQPSQGNPHQVKPKRQQGPKMSKPKSGDTTASQNGPDAIRLWSHSCRWDPMGANKRGAAATEGRDVEEPNRETRSKLTVTVALSPTPGRESCVEGQDSVEAPRSTTSQDFLVTLGDEIRRTEVVQCSSQQDYKTPGQPYLDLARDTVPEPP
jgi:hypothetical protein